MAPKTTHFIPFDSVGRFTAQAVCGAFVNRREHALEPTCAVCIRKQAEYEALDLGQVETPSSSEVQS